MIALAILWLITSVVFVAIVISVLAFLIFLAFFHARKLSNHRDDTSCDHAEWLGIGGESFFHITATSPSED